MVDPSLNKIYYDKTNGIENWPVELCGVNHISIIKNISFAEQYSLGGLYNSTLINAPQQIEVSIDRNYIGCDPFLKYTGSYPLNTIYLYNGGYYYYCVSNLYLNSYSIAFSAGEIPKITNKFVNYSSEIEEVRAIPPVNFDPNYYLLNNPEVGNHPYYSCRPFEHYRCYGQYEGRQKNWGEYFNYDIPKLNDICLSLFGAYYNIFSFDYELEMNRQPYFSIGDKSAKNINLITPLKINSNINFKLKKETESIDIFTNEMKQPNFDIGIIVNGASSQTCFCISKAQVVSTEIVALNNSTLEIKAKFLGYYGI